MIHSLIIFKNIIENKHKIERNKINCQHNNKINIVFIKQNSRKHGITEERMY